MTVLLVAFCVWLVVGLVLSVRSQVRRAGRDGGRRSLAAVAGVLLAVPVEWLVLGLAALAVLVWKAV